MRIYVVFAALVIGAAPAFASPPVYDIDKYCDGLVRQNGVRSERIYAVCVNHEIQSRDAMARAWDGATQQMQTYCDQLVSNGSASYAILKACIESEAEAGKDNKQPHSAVILPDPRILMERHSPLTKRDCRMGRLVDLQPGVWRSRVCISP